MQGMASLACVSQWAMSVGDLAPDKSNHVEQVKVQTEVSLPALQVANDKIY